MPESALDRSGSAAHRPHRFTNVQFTSQPTYYRSSLMGSQYNKVEKRVRRLRRIDRLKKRVQEAKKAGKKKVKA